MKKRAMRKGTANPEECQEPGLQLLTAGQDLSIKKELLLKRDREEGRDGSSKESKWPMQSPEAAAHGTSLKKRCGRQYGWKRVGAPCKKFKPFLGQ